MNANTNAMEATGHQHYFEKRGGELHEKHLYKLRHGYFKERPRQPVPVQDVRAHNERRRDLRPP